MRSLILSTVHSDEIEYMNCANEIGEYWDKRERANSQTLPRFEILGKPYPILSKIFKKCWTKKGYDSNLTAILAVNCNGDVIDFVICRKIDHEIISKFIQLEYQTSKFEVIPIIYEPKYARKGLKKLAREIARQKLLDWQHSLECYWREEAKTISQNEE